MSFAIRRNTVRLSTSLLLGLAVGAGVAMAIDSKFALLAGWDSFSLSLLAILWYDFRGKSAAETRRIARGDDMGSTVFDTVLTVAALVSLGAVGMLLTAAGEGVSYVVFGLLSIVLSWAVVHAIYALRYAVMYYDDHKDGIDFGSKQEPTFSDFTYVAYTIGMTYQVSDTTMTSGRFRQVALRHALLSFVFGVAIIATSINVVAGLGK